MRSRCTSAIGCDMKCCRFRNSSIRLFLDVLARQADILREDDQCLDELAEQQLGQLVKDNEAGECELRRPQFLVLPLALQRRVLRKIVQRCTGQPHGLSFSAVTVIINQVVHGCSGVRLTAGQVWAEREYDTIRVGRTMANRRPWLEESPSVSRFPNRSVAYDRATITSRDARVGDMRLESVSLPPTQIVLDADRVTLDLGVEPGCREIAFILSGFKVIRRNCRISLPTGKSHEPGVHVFRWSSLLRVLSGSAAVAWMTDFE